MFPAPPFFNDPPKGKCDVCGINPASHWFGQTSVALCGSEECARANQSRWDALQETSDRIEVNDESR